MKEKKYLGLFSLEEFISMVLGLVIVLLVFYFLFTFFRREFSGKVDLPGLMHVANEFNVVTLTPEQKNDLVAKNILKPGHLDDMNDNLYTVVAGDSLWKISKQIYGSGDQYGKLMKLNNLKNGRLEVGQKIVLPIVENSEEINVTIKQPILGSEYVVAYGDSLSKIALRAYGDRYAWHRIWMVNKDKISDPGLIFSGTKLLIPR